MSTADGSLTAEVPGEFADAPGSVFEPPINPATASWALFTGIALVMVGNGLQGSLLGIRSELEGFSPAASGLIMAAYFGGFLAGGKAATRALTLVGHIRVFAALASMASASSLVHALAVHPLSWFLMRFATGVCMAGLYVVAESWINDLATNATRGRLLALYMVTSMGGLAAGQFLLNLADPSGPELFLIASVLVSLSLVPVMLSARATPPAAVPEPMSLRDLLKVVPTGPTVSLLVGVSHGALMGMGAFYATRAGLSPGRTAVFMGAPLAGGVALQWPIGSISDRLSRRAVMLAVAVVATAAAGALLVVSEGGVLAVLAMFLLGGTSFPLYSLGLAYTNDWIRPEQAMGASVALVTTNGIGATLGPLLAAGLILTTGNRSYFVTLVASHGAIAVYLAYRVAFRDPLPRSRQGSFVAVPARASAMVMVATGRRRRRLDALAAQATAADTPGTATADQPAGHSTRSSSSSPDHR